MTTIRIAAALTLPLALAPAKAAAPAAGASSMPVLFYWRAEVAADQDADAVRDLFIRLTGHSAARHADAPLRLLVDEYTGSRTTHWFREHASLAARKQWLLDTGTDAEWQAMLEATFAVMEEDYRALLFPLGGAGADDGSKPCRWLQVTRSPAGHLPAARRLAKRVAEYLEANYPSVDARAYAADVDDPGAIFWMVDYESAGTWESVRARLLEDDGYLALFDGAGELFHDEVDAALLVNH